MCKRCVAVDCLCHCERVAFDTTTQSVRCFTCDHGMTYHRPRRKILKAVQYPKIEGFKDT